MPRSVLPTHFRGFTLDPDSEEPLHRQLYDELRRSILEGRLPAGSRIPASRELASVTRLSRNTVLAAYEQLMAEGYIEGRAGSGTFVSRSGPERMDGKTTLSPMLAALDIARREISKAAERFRSTPALRDAALIEADAFNPGLPALDHFPMDIWRRLSDRRLRNASARMLSYDDPQGYLPLRQAIAAHLGAYRGAHCTAEQVLIVSGSQQSLDLASRVLLDPGDQAWVEDPGYFAARATFEMAGARVVPVSVDDDGMVVSEGIAAAPRARLAYVTPSHHNPTCVTMSLSRRMALLQWAEQAGAWILEADNASEFHYEGHSHAALLGIDTNHRTLYFGTFSKILFASLRLGYIVAPLDLVPALVRAREFMDRQSPGWQQAVLADFISEGHLGRHVRRMCQLYRTRMHHFRSIAARYAGDLFEVPLRHGGMSHVAYFLSAVDDQAAAEAAQQAGVCCMPLSHYRCRREGRSGLVLGFTGTDEASATIAMQKLVAAIQPLRPLSPLVPGPFNALE
ncbi:MAG: PLP-dependent aminotransferase family protein [Candidatus Eisenbacteria bacterium]